MNRIVARAMVATAAALLQVVTLAPGAGAIEAVVPISEPEPALDSTGVPTDFRVTPVVTIGTDELPLGTPSNVDEPGLEIDGAATGASNCKRVWVRIDYKNWRGDVAFYFKQTKDWCWSWSTYKITSVSVTSSGHVYAWASPVWDYDGVISSNNYYYDNGRAHYSYREGKFTASCWGVYCGSRTPEIIIRTRGGGRWTYWTRG